jgi:hypothetical protein
MPGGFYTPPNPRDELIHVLSQEGGN